jgi:uncharacterized membrane protein YqaE (UPF0057 family)
MKKLSLLLVVALSTTLFLDSCSVQKRYHRTGFNVNWNHTSIGIKKDRHKIVTEGAVEEEVAVIEKVTPSSVPVVSKEVNVQEVTTPQVVNAYEALEAESTVASNNEVNSTFNVASKSNVISNENLNLDSKANFKSRLTQKIVSKKLSQEMKQKFVVNKSSSTEPWVYLLLILLVPFGTTIAMYLYEGSWTSRVTVNLILTLLCGLPGLIHALIIIFGNK